MAQSALSGPGTFDRTTNTFLTLKSGSFGETWHFFDFEDLAGLSQQDGSEGKVSPLAYRMA